VNLLARLFLAFALVTGAGTSILVHAEAQACGCCDLPTDPCPCGPVTPAPASHRIPGNTAAPVQAEATETVEAHQSSTPEARPLDGLPQARTGLATASTAASTTAPMWPRGRAPDLGRHLARLNLLRI